MIRFVHLFNYTDGTSKEKGERWYLDEHIPAARSIAGVMGYKSWPGIDVGIPFPSAGAPTPHNQFVRRSEIQFEDLESALEGLEKSSSLWAASGPGQIGFREFECMLLPEQPEFDLLRDAPQQQYKYMTLPLLWPKGAPDYDDAADIFIDSYCIGYRDDLTVAQGEDWYLGHHTREGKQLPGMKHYRTWRTIRVKEDLPEPLLLNKWFRLTELGMNPEAYKATMVHDDTRVRFTPSPFGWVIKHWLNIDIKPGLVQDLMG